jgi:hypothetical protein
VADACFGAQTNRSIDDVEVLDAIALELAEIEAIEDSERRRYWKPSQGGGGV